MKEILKVTPKRYQKTRFGGAACINPIQTGGGGLLEPARTLKLCRFKRSMQWPPNLVTFPKIYLETFSR